MAPALQAFFCGLAMVCQYSRVSGLIYVALPLALPLGIAAQRLPGNG